VKTPSKFLSINRWSLTVLALAAFSATSLAESGFRVSTETGLETGTQATPAKPAKKAKQPSAVGEKKPTEITCSKESTFDGKTRIVVFVGDVKVADPQFNLTCDKLTAYLKKGPETGGGAPGKSAAKTTPEATATPAATPEGAAKSESKKNDPSEASGLDRAVAEGSVIIIQDKVDPNSGEVTHYVGKGAKADYNSSTGEMVLSGWPQIQQGLNNQVATEEGTIMIMNRDGHLRTQGKSKTVLKSDSDEAKTDATNSDAPQTDKTKAELVTKP